MCYQVDGGEKRGGSFEVKAVARRKLTELESSVLRGQWVDPTDQTTVVEYAGSISARVRFLAHTVRVQDHRPQLAEADRAEDAEVAPHTATAVHGLGGACRAHPRVRPRARRFAVPHAAGRPYWHEQYTQKVIAPAVRKAKLPAGTTSHDLRHHYASVLPAAGESVIAVAERLGHENATLVLTVYGHLMPDSEDRTRKAVDAAWNAISGAAG